MPSPINAQRRETTKTLSTAHAIASEVATSNAEPIEDESANPRCRYIATGIIAQGEVNVVPGGGLLCVPQVGVLADLCFSGALDSTGLGVPRPVAPESQRIRRLILSRLLMRAASPIVAHNRARHRQANRP